MAVYAVSITNVLRRLHETTSPFPTPPPRKRPPTPAGSDEAAAMEVGSFFPHRGVGGCAGAVERRGGSSECLARPIGGRGSRAAGRSGDEC